MMVILAFTLNYRLAITHYNPRVCRNILRLLLFEKQNREHWLGLANPGETHGKTKQSLQCLLNSEWGCFLNSGKKKPARILAGYSYKKIIGRTSGLSL